MNSEAKKRVVSFWMDFLALTAVFAAITCLFLRLANLPIGSIDTISFWATRFALPRSINNFSSQKKMSITTLKNNISDKIGHNINAPLTEPSYKTLPPPEIGADDDDSQNPSNHASDEKTYKIIESQFGSNGIKCENFCVKNTAGIEINIDEELKKTPEINIKNIDKPQVLILHTHTSEAYMPKDQDFFYDNFYPRSTNNAKNVIRVGQEISKKLEDHGIKTIHETTYHDAPSYNGSYSRAAVTIKNILEQNPTIQVIIDIHRDSLGSPENGKIKPTFKCGDKKAAQLMIISGCDRDNTLGFPNWEKNLRLALRLQKYCENMFPGITRPLNLSKVKYNQHLTTGSMLIEIGSDVNTLEEALYTGSMLGEALGNLLNDLKNT